uniref:FAD-binding oxidoreductase n=1 Tax=candidate division WOR-3 bacterium TaxID=2052148 RepID=A0A7C4GJ56_UNCW3
MAGLRPTLLTRLRELIAPDRVVADPALLADYGHDESNEPPHLPDALVRAASTEEIAAVVRLCREEQIPVTPRGLGTGLAGGSVPVQGGVVVSTELMNRVLEVDCANLMARTQPGVRTARLQQACAEAGLYYPVDPASLDDCSIGGNVATNAGGARAFKYGVTGDYVRGIEAVMADASVIRYGGKLVKNVTGYDLNKLLIGSEGTLGIITEITFRLVPKPKHQVDVLVPFDNVGQGVELVLRLVRDDRLLPAVVEFVTQNGIAACNRVAAASLPFPDAAIQVLVELEGNDRRQVLNDCVRLGELAMELGAREPLVADNPVDQNRLWTARRSLAKTLKQVYSEVFAEDIVVPLAELPATVDFIAELERRFGLPIVPFGHIGDGNIHVDVCRDTPDRGNWQHSCAALIDELVDFVLQRGGQITAEHGIGSTRRGLMKKALGTAELETMRRLKTALDPDNLLNPGKILP